MKRRFLALAMTLAMVFSLLPAGILTINAETVEVPSCDTLYDIQPGASISFESATNTGTAMTKGNNNTSLSLEVVEQSPGAAVQIVNGYDATLGGIITDASERYIVLDMQIDKMPIWVDEEGNTKGPESGQGHSSTGFFIQARRPSVSEFNGSTELGSTNIPFVHVAIVRMDEEGNLGFAVESENTVFMAVEPLGKKLGDNFELAIGWLSDYSFEIYCDDVLLQTYNIAEMSPLTTSSGFTNGIRIGYNSYGSTADPTDGYAVNLNVNSVSFGSKVQRSHPEIGKDGKCTVCGNGDYFDFTSYEIEETAITLSGLTFKGTNNGIIDNTGETIKITQDTITTTNNDDDKLMSGAKPFDALVKDGEFFLTQELVINKMPVFETTNNHPHARSATGYYVIVPVKMDSNISEWGYFKICVYRIDDTDNLYVMNGTADKSSNIYYSDLYPLGVTLGDTFTLTAHITSNSNMDLYCNGNFVHRFTNAQTITSSNNYNLFVGYKSNGAVADSEGNQATDIEVFSIATGERVAHEHDGGEATCTEQATCDVCGEKYGDLNANNHKPGINGVCTLCGTDGYFDFTSYDIDETAIDFSTYTLSNSGGYIDISGSPITITQSAIVADTDKDANILKSTKQQPFDTIAGGTELFLTQDIRIDKMPVFTEFNHLHGRGGTGYYTLVPVDFDTADSTWNSFKICIYRIDNTDNLYVTLGTENYGIGNLYPLGVELGTRFTLLSHMKADGSMDLYCNGELVHRFTNEESFTSTSTNNNYFIVGYKSYGAVAAEDGNVATDIKVYSIAAGERVAHEHKGGTATCTEQATCEVCGEMYGQTAPHTEDTAASCTTHATCSVCGNEYGVYADHTPNDDGICTECQAETGYLDLQYQYTEEDGTVVNRVTAGRNSIALMSLSKYGAAIAADSVDLITGNTPNYTAVIRNAFAGEAAAHHISQTVTINKMPAFNGATYINGYTGTGYYNNLRRENSTAGTSGQVDNAMYSIYPNADGDLMVGVYTTGGWVVESLNRELEDTFRLETVWDTDGSLSVFCDGYLVIKVADATYDGSTQGDHSAAFSMGYMSNGAIEASYGTGAVDMSVSNIVISNGHIPAEDDGSCLTADVCSVCGIEFNEAEDAHVQADDDDNCVTPVLCGNPGCKYVFVEGHTLTHVDEVAATDDTTGTKEHWKCETDGNLYLDEAGTQKVTEGELVISPNFEVSGDKSTVNTDYVQDAIENAGEGDVALGITTPEIELPAAALDALVTSGNDLVISTSEGKITLNAAAIAAIKSAAAENALSINVKKAGTSVLQDAQTAALSTYTAIKDVITAEMLADTAITSFGTGAVIIEIPFELDSYGTDGDYKLVYVSDDGETVEVIENAVFADGKVTATLDHFSDYAIVYTGELPQEPVEGNTTITSNGGSSYATVTGTYVDGLASGDVFSVDVEWDGLSFNYMAANTWNPETHTNTGGGWEEATGSVTVVNHSNIDVTVSVTKADEGGEKNLGVVFLAEDGLELTGDTLSDKLDAGTAENVNSADSFVVTFKPQGELVDGDTDVTLATITVTITKYVES